MINKCIGVMLLVMSQGLYASSIPSIKALSPAKENISALKIYGIKNKGAIISLAINTSHTPLVSKKKKTELILSLKNAQFKPYLLQHFDVRDFHTIVSSMQASNTENGAVLSIRMNHPYTIDTIKTKTQIKFKIVPKVALKNKTISVNLKDVPINEALHLLANIEKVNLSISSSIKGRLSLSIHQLPWQQVFKIILRTENLGEEKVGNAYIVLPMATLIKQKKTQWQEDQSIQSMQPLSTALLHLKYAKANNLAHLLASKKGSLLSKRGTVSADERTNTLWVEDTPKALTQIKWWVKNLDKPLQQVLIKARIVNIDKQFEQQLGIRFRVSKAMTPMDVSTQPDELMDLVPANNITALKKLSVDLPVPSVAQMGGAASLGLALAKIGDGYLLDLELSALAKSGFAKIIASPRLITANQKEALIESGEEIPYQQATTSGATSIAFKKAVLSLKVTPQITHDNHIILHLKVNQDKPGPEVIRGVPSIDTREIQTQVLVNNGQTIVLGGITQKITAHHISRVPFLSHLPLLGKLFQHRFKENKQSELLIFITPKLIKPQT